MKECTNLADLLTGDVWLVICAVACAILIVLPIQLTLCFRAKKLFMKSLPAVLGTVAAITFYIMARTDRTWIAFVYLIVAFYSAVFLIFCGIEWGIWIVYTICAKGNIRCLRG